MHRISIVVLLLVACSDRSIGDPKADCVEVQKAAAARNADCTGAPVDDSAVLFESFDHFCGGVAAAIAKGSIRYHRDTLNKCRQILATGTCAAVGPEFGGLPYCREAYEATLANGAPCSSDLECASGVCVSTTGCPGTCQHGSFAQAGESCAQTPCQSPLLCFRNGSSAICILPAMEGSSCTDATGLQNLPCDAFSYCDAMGTRTCQPIQGGLAGDPCLSGTCNWGLNCVDGVCQPSKRLGEPCTPGKLECAQTNYASLYCQSSVVDGGTMGTCSEFPLSGPCGAVPGQSESVACRADWHHYCDFTSGMCVTVAGLGEPCTPRGATANPTAKYCGPDLECDGTCQPTQCF